MVRNEYPVARYARWWLGKRCRLTGQDQPFRKVVEVEWFGPPSGFYGDVELTFEDGGRAMVSHGDAFKPRKSDVEVEP